MRAHALPFPETVADVLAHKHECFRYQNDSSHWLPFAIEDGSRPVGIGAPYAPRAAQNAALRGSMTKLIAGYVVVTANSRRRNGY
jgi:hypothetical protein